MCLPSGWAEGAGRKGTQDIDEDIDLHKVEKGEDVAPDIGRPVSPLPGCDLGSHKESPECCKCASLSVWACM